MASVQEQLESYQLSAAELKSITNWPDELIDDYLELTRNIILLATTADSSQSQIDQNTTDIAANSTNISTNTTNISTNTTNIGLNTTSISNNTTAITDLQNNKANKNIPATVNNIAVLDAAGDLGDSGDLISDLLPLDFAGNPETNITANKSRLCVDTVGNQIYFNPTVGATTGWVAV